MLLSLHYLISLSQCNSSAVSVERITGRGSEDLEAFEQGECGSPPFALGPGCLHGDQLGCGRGWQLLVAGGGEGGRRGETEQRSVLTDVDSWNQTATLPVPPRPPHRLVKDMLHGAEVQTGRHLIEQTAITRGEGFTIRLTHLPVSVHVQLVPQQDDGSFFLEGFVVKGECLQVLLAALKAHHIIDAVDYEEATGPGQIALTVHWTILVTSVHHSHHDWLLVHNLL